MLTTDDRAIADAVRSMAGHGIPTTTEDRVKKARPWHRAATHAGYNMRMSNLLAAIGAAQIDRLDEMNDRRRSIARIYDAGLADLDGVATPVEKAGRRHVYQMYVIRCLEIARRDALVHALRVRGVEASVHFDPPVHLQPYYAEKRGGRPGLLPATERLAASVITLPIYPGMTDADAAFVVEAVRA
jgi:dTDP-4-amino-4,6-dideoxygalactose transaminase